VRHPSGSTGSGASGSGRCREMMRKELEEKLARRLPAWFSVNGEVRHGTNAPLREAGGAGGEG
jgi:hypothetical protein